MKHKKNWLLGIIIIAVGSLMLLNNLGITSISLGWIFKNFWPLILVAVGVNFLQGSKRKGELITGTVLVLLGFILVGNNLNWYDVDMSFFWKLFWPVIIILIGLNFLRGPSVDGKNNTAIMSGIEKTQENWTIEDGTYWAVMGGIKLDLRKAVLEDNKQYNLACNAIMGGIEIIVPDDVTVYCEGSVILGGIELLDDETGGIYSTLKTEHVSNNPNSPVINIHNQVVMGGLELKAKKR